MPDFNWMRDGHPSLGWDAWAETEERRKQHQPSDQRRDRTIGVLLIIAAVVYYLTIAVLLQP